MKSEEEQDEKWNWKFSNFLSTLFILADVKNIIFWFRIEIFSLKLHCLLRQSGTSVTGYAAFLLFAQAQSNVAMADNEIYYKNTRMSA